MRLTIMFFLSFLSVGLVAQSTSWKTAKESSVISYSAAHILHPWKGINKNILGIAVVDSSNESIEKMAILVYVKDFDSNNSNRDAHALEVLEALQFPQVKFFSEKISINNEQVNLEGTLDFHGEKAPLEIVGKANWFENKLKLSGNFVIQPTKFKVELPTFMMIPINDKLEFDFELTFEDEKK